MKHNELIAEFMRLPKVPCNIGTEDGHFNEGYKHPKVDVPIIPSGMQYQTSWDWLMPVVDKIYSIDADIDFFKNISLKDTYKGVVQFIKDYNTKKKDSFIAVLKSIMTRYGGLTNLICQLREDSDVAYVNIADDTNMVVNEHEVEDIINQLIR